MKELVGGTVVQWLLYALLLLQRLGGTLVRSATVSTASGMEERVLIEGDLQKLGRRFKRWHQRYFRIKGSHMYYYKKAVSNSYPSVHVCTFSTVTKCMSYLFFIITIEGH